MARFADVTGRYVYLTLDGVEYRVYFEESGEGVPLLLQHTAGSDGRQWRHLLEDPDITSRFRVVAHDLPYHGRSLPPTDIKWWETEYSLTGDFFMRFLVALAHELDLERPVYMGCSMGGHLAPDLAINHSDEFRAFIGLEAALATTGTDELLPWFFHPRLGNDSKPSQMYTLMAPQSPEPYKRETIWEYSQGAPVVFKGDLNYYAVEHDVTETARNIDAEATPFYVLSGEYDWSGYPAACQALADEVKGSSYTLMRGVGHFPMSENPEQFKRYLLPVLEEILERTR